MQLCGGRKGVFCHCLCGKNTEKFLAGKEFTINTDHAPLQWLHRRKTSNQRLLRWSLILQEFSFTISYMQARRTLLQMYYLDVMIFSYPLSVTFTVVYIFTFEGDDMFTKFYFNLIYFVISDIF
jgi:hypothetical protein